MPEITLCVCGHSHFSGNQCWCGCTIYEPDNGASDEARRVARLIQQCRAIAAIFDELLPDTAIDANAQRRGGVNPYYNRTSSGLYLEQVTRLMERWYGYPILDAGISGLSPAEVTEACRQHDDPEDAINAMRTMVRR